jgi:uncharacterized protein (TIGR00369 family)
MTNDFKLQKMSAKEILKLYNEMNHFGRKLNMHFEVVRPGEVTYYLEITEDLLATKVAAHGGALSAFMDAVLGVAALSASGEEGKLVSTIEFKITYLHPAFLGDKLKGIGKVIKQGKRMIFSEGEVFNQKNELIVKGTGTFIAYPVENLRK